MEKERVPIPFWSAHYRFLPIKKKCTEEEGEICIW